MLTREGFVAADMSGQSKFQRSSWKAEAIRKGNLKISGPIPITEDMPLNEEEEKEFAETGALSPGQPQDEQDQLDSRPQTPQQPEHPPPSIPIDRGSLTSHPIDEEVQEVLQARQSRSPPRLRQVVEMARESVVEPATPSRNGFRATPDSAAKSAQKKKRKSGLRGVFRKMFGRKDKDAIEEEEPTRRGHSYHHSVSYATSSAAAQLISYRIRVYCSNHHPGKPRRQVELGYLIFQSRSWNLFIRLDSICHIQ
jgi:hypothetical protein